MKIKRMIQISDSSEVEMEFELTLGELECAYREQEANYYHSDVISFLGFACDKEDDEAERIADDIWDSMYDYYRCNGNSDLSYWENMQAAYEEVTEYGWGGVNAY